MILRITHLQVVGPFLLKLVFNDGTDKIVDVSPLLIGPVFEPLKDPHYFAQIELDPFTGTAVWLNDIDLAPEALHDLPPLGESAATTPLPAR